MEEKFLKQRQEREEQRLVRSLATEECTVQRQQYEVEAEKLEAEVLQLLQAGSIVESQEQIDALRTLVQDTANSISLTAHEMAKANAVLARLQQLVLEKQNSVVPKKFKFSSRLKSKPEAGVAAETPKPVEKHSAATSSSDTLTGFGNAYGPFTNTTVFITHSKGAFVRDCTDCSIYCLPIAGSVFFVNCANCKIYVASHQLRLKDCARLDLYVWCASTPIIETSREMRFGPYRCWAGLLHSFAADGKEYGTHGDWVSSVGEIADTARTELNYTNVDDFQWVKKTASPHWRVMRAEEEEVSSVSFGPATPPTSSPFGGQLN